MLATGRQAIELPGMRIDLNGAPEDGDIFIIKPKQGQAESLSFAITDPNRIAAAARQLVYASTANKSDAQLDVRMQSLDPVSGIGTVQDVFSNGASAIGATVFCVMRQWLLSRKMFRRSSCFRWHASRS